MYEADRRRQDARAPPPRAGTGATVDTTQSAGLPGAVPGLVYSVTELNESVRDLITRQFPEVWVRGEISNLSRPGSGHAYFSLKDDAAQVRCAMFRARLQRLKFRPENGLEVVVRASVGLYVQRGEFQLVVEEMDPAGAGALQARFEALKAKLSTEGLFSAERKRDLPAFPQCVGVVTSATGAALRDILSVLARRAPGIDVVIYPCLVQGDAAAASIVRALDSAYARGEADVLIVARGGGSLEDLWPFNEEVVARRLAEAPMPVISGVGHETDFSITDMVADVRAPTPSAAAELCSRHLVEVGARLDQLTERLMLASDRHLQWLRQRLEAAARALTDPSRHLRAASREVEHHTQRIRMAIERRLQTEQQRARGLEQRLARNDPRRLMAQQKVSQERLETALARATRQHLGQLAQRLEAANARLEALSPLATLNRGYAIVYGPGGNAVRAPGEVGIDETVRVKVQHGEFHARRLPGPVMREGEGDGSGEGEGARTGEGDGSA